MRVNQTNKKKKRRDSDISELVLTLDFVLFLQQVSKLKCLEIGHSHSQIYNYRGCQQSHMYLIFYSIQRF